MIACSFPLNGGSVVGTLKTSANSWSISESLGRTSGNEDVAIEVASSASLPDLLTV